MAAKLYRNKTDMAYYIADGAGQTHGPYISRDAAKAEWPRIKRNRDRRERDQVMRDMGLTKVKGALGGVYWE